MSQDAVFPDALAPHAVKAHAEHYDPVASKLGMWLFLFSEVLLFGTLFILYAVYLTLHHFEFAAASREIDKLLGAANTVILLTSSLTMALGIAAMERANRRLSLAMLTFTVLLGLAFLVIKGHEWHHKFEHDLYPKSATMLAKPYGEQIFYGLYYCMTGLHALHVIVGSIAILSAMALIRLGRIHPGRYAYLRNTGLYWHLVDLIWILLFPVFYLIG